MPPAAANTPRERKKRDNQHLAHIGQEGRKTGITVREHARDEDGFEDPGEFFSSASKAPTTARTARASRKRDSMNIGSEDMDLALSPAPDPVETLSIRRSRSGGHVLPQSRSPKKTNIGATPRRPQSDSTTRSNVTPQSIGLPSSGGNVSRLLDFSRGNTRSSLRPSLRSTNGSPGRSDAAGISDAARVENSIYSLTPSPERATRPSVVYKDQSELSLRERNAENATADSGDASFLSIDHAMAEEGNETYDEDIIQPTREEDDLQLIDGQDGLEGQPSPNADAELHVDQPNIDPSLDDSMQHEQGGQESPVNDDHILKAPTLARKSKRGRPPMTEKDRNKKTAKFTATTGFKKPYIPGIAHPLQRARGKTPFEDEGNVTTRSGRVVYKPLATWKNERAIFQVTEDEQGVPISSISSIVRMDDVTPIKRKAGPMQNERSRQGTKRRQRKHQDVIEDEDILENSTEPWEREEGVMYGLVRTWDASQQTSTNTLREEQIAFAAASVEAQDNTEGSFRFAKTLTTPFFGSGVVEVPPGGFKRMRNSRKMQMMFFVHHGRVLVRVADTQFTINKGGTWQVPRGNFYTIENETETPAKIFFSLGCEVDMGSTL